MTWKKHDTRCGVPQPACAAAITVGRYHGHGKFRVRDGGRVCARVVGRTRALVPEPPARASRPPWRVGR